MDTQRRPSWSPFFNVECAVVAHSRPTLKRYRPMLSIHSTSSNRELHISRGQGGYVVVEIVGHRVTALTEVWIDDDAAHLGRFFVDLGENERPWKGTREWQSIEGDLKFSVTCNALGNVTFDIHLSGMPGAPEEWSVRVGLDTELGQLQRIGEEAGELLNSKDTL